MIDRATRYLTAIRFAVPRLLLGKKATASFSGASWRLEPRTAIAVLVAALAIAAIEARADAPYGRWYIEGGAAQVEIEPCDRFVCGRVVWVATPFDQNGCALRDAKNPEESRRHLPLVGLQILRGLQAVEGEPDVWTGGRIYDPDSGNDYSVRMTRVDDDRLELRGYVGLPLLGRTTRWIRVGSEDRVCRAASARGG